MKFLVLLSLVAYCAAVPIGSVYRTGVDYPYGRSTVYDYLRHTFGVSPYLGGHRGYYGTGIYGTGIYDDAVHHGVSDYYLPHHMYGDVAMPHHVYGAYWPHSGIYGSGIYGDVLKHGVYGAYGRSVAGVVPDVVADIKTVSGVYDDDTETLHHQQLVQEQQLQIQQQLQQQQLQQQQQLLHEEQRLAQHQLYQEEENMNKRHFIQHQQLKELQERVQEEQLKQKVQLDQLQNLHHIYPRHGGFMEHLMGGVRTGLPIAGVY
ncbi:unnamed protein product [Acanthoscelides obtectus]|uniref:Uncharacterized protein n=1 Tax=Acanthoscelides obtectus TaxID=200917 RepID=A0A9P0MKG1_ACAOB|nr:unnamed protein product [Acanthoscelides obtectus]CAK1637543.1 Protein PF14_0175 [Acanthoscelides obtectus]